MIGSQEKVMRVQHFVLELCCPYCKKDNSHYSNLQIEVISAAVCPLCHALLTGVQLWCYGQSGEVFSASSVNGEFYKNYRVDTKYDAFCDISAKF